MGRTARGDSMNVKKENQEKTSQSGTAVQDDFHWDSYLKETGSLSAPADCFRQSKIPPTNEFKVGMKLEAHDPRNTTSTCIATIIGVTGARLRLRLDGSDDKNDFWRLVDSSDIQPVGTCEQQGDLLQPPLGYQMSTSSWPMFLLRTLDGSEMAPATFFKEEPPKPALNNFKVGMKLEAVDKKNPDMICPATIGGVRGDEVHITFDGWSGAFDYWCKYYCRDIFPVGWCRLAGDVLQPPGTNVPITKNTAKRQSSLSKATQQSMQSAKKTTVASPTQKTKKPGRAKPTGRTPGPKKQSSAKTVTPRKKPPKKEKSIPVMCSTSTTSVKMLTRGRGVEYKDPSPGSSKIMMSTVCVYINKHGDCGPYLDQNKIQQLPDHFGPGPVNVVLRRTVQACVDCGIESKTVFGFLKPDNRGGEMITAFFDGETHSIQLPPVNSASFALRFLENFCHSLQCDNLLSSQPFSAYRGNTPSTAEDDQNNPVEEDLTEKQTTKRPSEQPLSDVAPLPPKLLKTEMHASQVEEDLTEKQTTKRPSEQPLSDVAPLPPKLLKTEMHASQVEEDLTEKQTTKRPSEQPLSDVAPLPPKLLKTEMHASQVEEDIAGKQTTEGPSEQNLSDVAPLSPKLPKTEMHASQVEEDIAGKQTTEGPSEQTDVAPLSPKLPKTEMHASQVEEDIAGKQTTEGPSEQNLSDVAPLSPKLPKTEMHASQVEEDIAGKQTTEGPSEQTDVAPLSPKLPKTEMHASQVEEDIAGKQTTEGPSEQTDVAPLSPKLPKTEMHASQVEEDIAGKQTTEGPSEQTDVAPLSPKLPKTEMHASQVEEDIAGKQTTEGPSEQTDVAPLSPKLPKTEMHASQVEEDIAKKQTTKRPSEQPLSDVAPLSPKLPRTEMHASQVEEEVTKKQTTKRPSHQLLSDAAPLSPKFRKTEMHASQEERLSSEGKGITKDSPLNPDNSLNPASGDPIITDTAVSKNFPDGVPVSSGSALVDTSSPQSGPHEFQMQKNSEAPSYIAVPDPSVLKQGFSKDPSTWCVDEVIQFMKHKDPQISGPLADLFRQHEIDGKALLLLKSDLVMKYMGLKLGPALKLCYYIEKLKEGKHNFKNV